MATKTPKLQASGVHEGFGAIGCFGALVAKKAVNNSLTTYILKILHLVNVIIRKRTNRKIILLHQRSF
jgi:hypothetical protein